MSTPPPPAPPPLGPFSLVMRVLERHGVFWALLVCIVGYVAMRVGSQEVPLLYEAIDRYGRWAAIVAALVEARNIVRDFLTGLSGSVAKLADQQARQAIQLAELITLLRGGDPPDEPSPPPPSVSRNKRPRPSANPAPPSPAV